MPFSPASSIPLKKTNFWGLLGVIWSIEVRFSTTKWAWPMTKPWGLRVCGAAK